MRGWPHFRSAKTAVRWARLVEEFKVATEMPAEVSCETWFCSRARRGEMQIVTGRVG